MKVKILRKDDDLRVNLGQKIDFLVFEHLILNHSRDMRILCGKSVIFWKLGLDAASLVFSCG